MKTNGRRLNGEGTIRWVKSRNSYHGQIRLTVDGLRKRKDVYGKTRGEVRDKLREANRQSEAGVMVNDKTTVAQYLEGWYRNVQLAQKSIDSRVVNINRMNPYIGEIKLTKLRAAHIEGMYEKLDGPPRNLKPTSVHQVHSTLRKALNDARKKGYISHNPMDRLTETPSIDVKEIEPLSIAEVNKLLSLNNEWTPLFTLLVGTGLRRGEALGLAWDHVDLTAGTLKVTRSLVSTRAGTRFVDPKTDESRRTVPLNDSVVRQLNAHRVRQAEYRLGMGKHWQDNDLVFPSTIGTPREPAVVNRALARSITAAGIDRKVRVHDLRHTCASLMIENGVPPKVVQDIMGHSSYTVTMNIYVHTNPAMLRSATDILDAAIGL